MLNKLYYIVYYKLKLNSYKNEMSMEKRNSYQKQKAKQKSIMLNAWLNVYNVQYESYESYNE